MFLLPGVAGFLFVPMAEAVVFAMIASFVLSRTLVPTMAMYLLKPHDAGARAVRMEGHGTATHGRRVRPRNPLARFQHGFERRFEQVARRLSRRCWRWRSTHRRPFVIGFLAFVLASFAAGAVPGRELLPRRSTPARSTLHVRAPVGTRIEDTAALFDHVEAAIRQIIPPAELGSIVDNIGLPVSGINRAYINTGGIGPQDGDIYVSLNEHHHPTADYVKALRAHAAARRSRLDLLVPAGRHHQPDPELRRAGADRRAGRRARTARPTRPMPTELAAQAAR